MINNPKQELRLIAIDLDGTLLSDEKKISDEDRKSLMKLGAENIVRVAATGRSLFKVEEVLPENTPFDYVVFSSGAGIFDWMKKELLHCEFFDRDTIVELMRHLLAGNYNFFVYKPIPQNNLFYYHQGADFCFEFQDYLNRHEGDYQVLSAETEIAEAGQFMAIIKNDGELFEELKTEILEACPNVKVIRTTSPVNKDYIWLEIFPNTVSKGHGIQWLCDNRKIDYSQTVGIGNDYNDLDMFDFVASPFVVGNGIGELKEDYPNVQETNNESAVSVIVQQLFSGL